MAWATMFTINAELYPTHIRSTGVGWGNAMAKLGGIVAPAFTGFALSGLKVIGILVLISGSFMGAGLISFMFRETRVVTEDRKKYNKI